MEAARKEGTVVVSGPAVPEIRTALPAAFKNRFGVELEYLGGNTSDLMNRLQAERAAGQHTLDAMIAGAQAAYTIGYPQKMYDPLPPALIHPEVTDPTKWIGGRLRFMDPEQQYILRVLEYLSLHLAVNTQYVRPDEIQSWHDLLDPKYRGKISVWEPTVSGTGWNTANYLLRALGEDYIRGLYQGQQPGVSRDSRQLADWMARGTYPISLGLGNKEIETLKQEGFPIAVLMGLPDARGYVTAGFGNIMLMNPAPHPHAARLLVNWFAMKEGQEVYNRANGTVSLRADVEPTWAPDYIVPKPGVEYLDSNGWDYTIQEFTPEKLERIRRLVGK